VVRSCARLGHTSKSTEFLNDLTFKIATLVAVKPLRKGIKPNEMLIEGFSCGLSGLISTRHGLSIPSEMVCNDKDMLKAPLRLL
jgi:hypothetical protein